MTRYPIRTIDAVAATALLMCDIDTDQKLFEAVLDIARASEWQAWTEQLIRAALDEAMHRIDERVRNGA